MTAPQEVVQLGLERSGRTEPESFPPSERQDWMSDEDWAAFKEFDEWAAAVNGLRIDPPYSGEESQR